MTSHGMVALSGRRGNRRPLTAARNRTGERVIRAALAGCAAISVLVTAGIVMSLLFGAIDFFRQVPIREFLLGTVWAPAFADAHFGVLPIVVGTLNVVFWAMLVAVPIGLLSAIYLSEYASARVRRLVKPALEVLEGIPTVAIGLFALYFLVPLAADAVPFLQWGTFSIGVAGAAVGLLIVPLVASVSDDAIRSVPRALREGAYALGASRLRVTTRVVFPAAVSGIVASLVLAVSRAIGETMVVLIVGGARPQLTADPSESALTMTAHIGQTATGDIGVGTVKFDTIFAVGALLFVLTLAMNMLAIRLVRRLREVYE